jgi:hypothetical protein
MSNCERPDEPTQIGPELKYTIKRMIREVIKHQNNQMLFTCRECCFYLPPVEPADPLDEDEDEDAEEQEEVTPRPFAKCDLDENNQLVLDKRMPTHLPECFNYDPLTSGFAAILTLMYSLGVDTINAKTGWATVIGRLAERQDRFGYIHGVTKKNLERYGT